MVDFRFVCLVVIIALALLGELAAAFQAQQPPSLKQATTRKNHNNCRETATQLGLFNLFSGNDQKTRYSQPAAANAKNARQQRRSSKWNRFKGLLYSTADGLKRLVPQKMRGLRPATAGGGIGGIDGIGVQDGYVDVRLPSTVLASYQEKQGGRESPGERLMRAYKERQASGIVSSSSSSSAPADEGLPEPSVFDKFKGAVYDTVDAISSSSTTKATTASEGLEDGEVVVSPLSKLSSLPSSSLPLVGKKPQNDKKAEETASGNSKPSMYFAATPPPPSSLSSTGSSSSSSSITSTKPQTTEFKPMVQPNLANSKQVQEALPDLQSENPVTRTFAAWKIRDAERKQRERAAVKERAETAAAVKEGLYKVADAVEWTAGGIASIPGATVSSAKRVSAAWKSTAQFLSSVPDKTQRTMDAVAAIPGRVEQKAVEVQTQVESGINATKQVVDDVRAIPGKVQRTAQQTKQSIEDTVETVQDATTQAKVLLGLEKAKPKPPKVPPPIKPKLSAKDMALKATGAVATGTVKAAWWLGRGASIMAWEGAQVAFERGSKAIQKRRQQGATTKVADNSNDESVKTVEAVAASSGTTTLEPPKQGVLKKEPKVAEEVTANVEEDDDVKTKEEDSELDLEVENALQLARDALEMVANDTAKKAN